MDIIFTKHLKDKAGKRGIVMEYVNECVQSPDFMQPDPKDAELTWYIKKYDGRCLVVVAKEEDGRLKCITTFYDRRLRRKGLCG